MSSRSAEAGIDGSASDPGHAEDVDALPVDTLIDAADRARSSGSEARQVKRPVKPRPWVGCANCLDQHEGRQQRTCEDRGHRGHASNYTTGSNEVPPPASARSIERS